MSNKRDLQRRVRIRFDYPLGDTVAFAGVLRELHRSHPGVFDVEIESKLADFWQSSPYARAVPPIPLAADAAEPSPGEVPAGREWIHADGRFFEGSERPGRHMIHALAKATGAALGIPFPVTELRGDVFMTPEEMAQPGPVEQLLGRRVPYWILCNGGKFDCTVKWWPNEHYQAVVDAFRGRVLFVQVGRTGDYHPKLKGTLDFRGWTDIRQLQRMVYWSDGVVCPITSLLHLAGSVPRPLEKSGVRPCVVVGGGIEPPSWTTYPGQVFLSTIGELPCTKQGCWKARTVSLGDGDPRDHVDLRCVDVDRLHPRCMRVLEPSRVVHAVQSMIDGGRSSVLGAADLDAAESGRHVLVGAALNDRTVTRKTVRLALERHARHAPRVRFGGQGRGIATLVCGLDFIASGWVMVRLLRHLGCRLPVEVWVMEPPELLPALSRLFSGLGAEVREMKLPMDPRAPRSSLFAAKPEVLIRSAFEEVLWLDADSFCARDPSFLFEEPAYKETGALFWPEPEGYLSTQAEAWLMFGVEEDLVGSEVQGGELLVNKRQVSPAIHLTRWCNRQFRLLYTLLHGDKDIYRLAFKKLGMQYAMPPGRAELRDDCLFQRAFDGEVLFQHRVSAKLRVGQPVQPVRGFQHESLLQQWLEQFSPMWAQCLEAK